MASPPSNSLAESSQAKTESPRPSQQHQSLLTASASGATFLILLQVSSRLLTFLANQILLRYLSAPILGLSAQLELYLISVLYFSRESLRVAVQRLGTGDEGASTKGGDGDRTTGLKEDVNGSVKANGNAGRKSISGSAVDAEAPAGRAQTVINLSYIPIILGIPIALSLGGIYLRSATNAILDTPYIHLSLLLFGIAAILELLTEPCFAVVQQKMRYRIRAGAESAATVSRCAVTCGCAWAFASRWGGRGAEGGGKDVGVLPFALGQMAYAVVLLLVYGWKHWEMASREGFSLFPRSISSRHPPPYLLTYFSPSLLHLSLSLSLQSGVKHILTQGDTLLIGALASLEDQGVYALASAYGGLIARMLFQPIEETSRALFANLLAPSSSEVSSPHPSKTTSNTRLLSATTLLTTLTHLYLLLGLLALTLGPPILPLLLTLLTGPRWSTSGAGPVLALYSYYIPLLALNGISEAFIAAVATPEELHRQSVAMFGFSVVFAGAGALFLKGLAWGARGLVWANVVGMAGRIVWSALFIERFLKKRGAEVKIGEVLPSVGSVAAAVATRGVLVRVQAGFTGHVLEDLVKCGAVAVPFGLVL
ncbi:MAG: Oligosaccharide translocation protein rft1 [Caeruleum heppii]|nr:MAG: Oligosaccharide translocation protein rft1 [Caeruleum heppii]